MTGKRFLVAALCLLALLIGLQRLYYRQNGGFSLAKILSNVQPTSAHSENLQAIDALLDQPFHFLGSGGTSFSFLGQDAKTVLKLFKHQHLAGHHFLMHVRFPGVLDAWRVSRIQQAEQKHLHKRQAFFFNSCSLAYQNLKQETGLLFLCLTPDSHFSRQIKLIDAWGIPHYLDLSRTEFALQKKADLLFPYLEKKLADKAEAKAAIDALVALIRSRCAKGIGDRDPNLEINFGFAEGRAIEFDLGSYFANPTLNTPFATARELFFSTYALQKWLEKHSPELLEYCLEQIILKSNETRF